MVQYWKNNCFNADFSLPVAVNSFMLFFFFLPESNNDDAPIVSFPTQMCSMDTACRCWQMHRSIDTAWRCTAAWIQHQMNYGKCTQHRDELHVAGRHMEMNSGTDVGERHRMEDIVYAARPWTQPWSYHTNAILGSAWTQALHAPTKPKAWTQH